MARRLSIIVTFVVFLMTAAQVSAAGGATGLGLTVPASADTSTTLAVSFSLPVGTAAVDGRLLLDKSAAEVVGLAPVDGGVALAPVDISGGYAFGAYGLAAKSAKTTVRVIIAPLLAGRIQINLVIDAAADAAGHRLALGARTASATIVVDHGTALYASPAKTARPGPTKPATATRDVLADGALGKMDLDLVRAAWEIARANNVACGSGDLSADANGDGCVDIVDIQAMAAAQGQRIPGTKTFRTGDTVAAASTLGGKPGQTAAAAPVALNQTFTVTSAADTPDATNGDGICANASGQCTLRAAVTEANWSYGPNRIEFNLAGTAPVAIQVGSMMTLQDRTGGVTIDGYTQPGSSVNTAGVGSNAKTGVILVGTGDSPSTYGFRITSPSNTVRGISFNSIWKPLVMDGVDAHDNRVLGNLFGYNANGAPQTYTGYSGVELLNGANHNAVGTPLLADRNVSGHTGKAFYMYGPGTDYNMFQNNVMCIAPDGVTGARCQIGVDHDFGPKHNLVGGSDPGTKNVVGPTGRQAVEISHGWDPSGNPDPTGKWQLVDNHVAGNWLGFKADGSYDASFRSGLDNPGSGDNGNGVNVHDGSNNNVIEGNFVASVYDGIQVMSPNTSGNIVRNNIIGVSPLGQAAPLTRNGISIRINTRSDVVEGNIVRNAGKYGIGVVQKDVLWVRISHNIISDMSGPAIFFAVDPADPTKGADELIPAPVITSATTTDVSGTGIAGATVELYQADRGAGLSGLPVAYLGSSTIGADGHWAVPATLHVGDRATALQILPNGNTSSLALNVAATIEQATVPVANFTWTQVAGTLEVDFSDASTGGPTSWTWSFGDGISATSQNPAHTYADGGDYTVVLTASNSAGQNSIAKTVTVQTQSAVVVAKDSFTRTANGGWGAAEVGGGYTVSNPTNFAVNGSVGTMTVPVANTSRSALLNISQRNQDILVRVAANKAAAGGKMFVYAPGRVIGNSEYRPRLVFNPGGGVAVSASMFVNGVETLLVGGVAVPGLVYTPGQFVWLRAQLSGANPTTIRVKAWANGQPEPAGWLITTTNSNGTLQAAGGAGLRTYVESTSTNAPVQFSFDDYSVTSASSATTVATDAFERTKSSTWGNADIGGKYTLVGNAANFNVANGVGTVDLPAGNATRSVLLNDVSQTSIDTRFQLATNKLPVGGNVLVYAVARLNTNNEYRAKLTIRPDGKVVVNASVLNAGAESPLGTAVVVPGLTVSAGSFIWFHAQVNGKNPTTIRINAWADGQQEPAGWQFTTTNSLAALQGAGTIGLRTYLDSKVSNAVLRISFDDYSVTTSL